MIIQLYPMIKIKTQYLELDKIPLVGVQPRLTQNDYELWYNHSEKLVAKTTQLYKYDGYTTVL